MHAGWVSGDEDLRARVRQVIASSGLTQTAFAQAIELEPTKLSKALAGTRRFTPLELALIAEQGRTSTDWLLNGSSARPTLAAWADQATVSSAAQDACAKAEDLDEIYETLVALGRCGQPPALPRFRPHGPLTAQGEALATAALRFLAAAGAGQHANDPALPDTIERVFGINVVIEDLRPGFDGLAWCRNGFRLILVSNATSWTRQRFSIAHELGHILAGDAQDLQVDIDVMAPLAKQADTERRANAFAASFLMPAEVINVAAGNMDDDAFARLVGRFGVSPSALSWRLLNLGRIDDRERRRLAALALWECAQRGGWLDRYRELTRDQSKVRRPGLLSRDVLQAFEDGDVSARVAARVLDISPETLLPPAPPAQRSNGLDDLVFAP